MSTPLIVNFCNQIRGGGGPTFGILTSLTYTAHPPTSITLLDAVPLPGISIGLDETERILRALGEVSEEVGGLGMGGAFFVGDLEGKGEGERGRGGATVFRGVVPGVGVEGVKEVMHPFLESVGDLLEAKWSEYPVGLRSTFSLLLSCRSRDLNLLFPFFHPFVLPFASCISPLISMIVLTR